VRGQNQPDGSSVKGRISTGFDLLRGLPREAKIGEAVGRRRTKASAAVNFEAVKESLLKGIMTKKVENEGYKTLSHVGQSFVKIL
jgi:hypothetical protein